MSEETETIADETLETAEAVVEEPVAAEETAPPAPQPVAPPPTVMPKAHEIDVDAEFEAQEALITKMERGDITTEEYNRDFAKHQRNITHANRQAAAAVQQPYKQAQAARQYWGDWGKGQDLAQVQFASKVPVSKAQALYQQAVAEIAANPRYNRPEFDAQTVIYDKFMNMLESEANKKPAIPGKPAAAAPSGRVSGSAGVNAPSTPTPKTAREKLDAGEYGDLGAEARRLYGA